VRTQASLSVPFTMVLVESMVKLLRSIERSFDRSSTSPHFSSRSSEKFE
jgi:hypothetical protein